MRSPPPIIPLLPLLAVVMVSAGSPRRDHRLRGPPCYAFCYFAHMTTMEIESFHDAGARAGALTRHLTENLIQTTLAFKSRPGRGAVPLKRAHIQHSATTPTSR